MFSIMIKYGTIALCSFLVFFNVNRLKNSLKENLQNACFFILIGFVFGLLRALLFEQLHICFWVATLILSYLIQFKDIRKRLVFQSALLSIGLSYIAFVISCIPIAIIASLIRKYNIDLSIEFESLQYFFISVIQIAVTLMLFRVKRIKSGLPYIVELGTSDIGIFISTILIFLMCLFIPGKEMQSVYIIPIVIIFLCCFLFLFWQKNQIKKTYIDKTRYREIETLKDTIHEKDRKISELQNDNEELSKIIHRDNKLIPALTAAVNDHLKNQSSDATAVLSQLNMIYNERVTALERYETTSKKLPKTGIATTDAVISYMQQEAAEKSVNLDVIMHQNVEHITDVVEESDLNTLLADLIQNAIIASSNCEVKSVLVCFDKTSDIYSINIYDSGQNFDIEVLNNIGLKRTTTHLNDGGSGIGLMTTFEILEKYSAGFIIEEFANNANYTKRVGIIFDNSNSREIISDRFIQSSDILRDSPLKILEPRL